MAAKRGRAVARVSRRRRPATAGQAGAGALAAQAGSGALAAQAGSGARGVGGAAGGIWSMQRARVLAAAVGVIAERGYADASVAVISARAGVSRRTFYELFDNREQCLVAILRDVEARMEHELTAVGGIAGWRERVRAGLWAILSLLDSEPALARACLLESQRAGAGVLAERERILARLAEVVDEGRIGDGAAHGDERGGSAARRHASGQQGVRSPAVGPLTAEALVGAVAAVLQARLAHGTGMSNAAASPSNAAASPSNAAASPSEVAALPLCDMLGELTALIVLPYRGAAAARRERMRKAPGLVSPPLVPVRDLALATGTATATAMDTGTGTAMGTGTATGTAMGTGTVARGRAVGDPLAGLPARFTYRTGRVLQAVAELGEGAEAGPSNRAVAERAGVRDPGQISKLLARLRRLGLLVNAAPVDVHARGEANRWALTPAGRRLLEVIGAGESSEGRNAEWLSRAMPVRRAES